MIPIGKCKCMACNAEFYADEAIYHIKFDFSQNAAESEEDMTDSGALLEDDNLDEMSALTDTLDGSYDDDLPTECELSLKQLADAGGTMFFKGVAVRLLRDNDKVDGKTSTGKITASGRVFFDKVYFGYRYGNNRERAVEGLRKYRTCPSCGSSKGLGESMGFRDNYLIMMFGNSSSGKTTWLKTIYDMGGINAHVMGYKMTNSTSNEAEWTREHIKARIHGEISDETIQTTAIQSRQEDLCAYYSLSRKDSEIGFIFRDVAGEVLSHDNIDLSQAEMAREFARYADGILIFRDVLSLPRIIDHYIALPRNRESLSLGEYQSAIQDMLTELKVEINQDLFRNRDIAESWENLHIPDDKIPAVMYVLNKSDLLRNMINRSVDVMEGDDETVPFDYRCDQATNSRPVLTDDSAMFRDCNHYNEFDMRNYLNCALETNHFISFEDYAFCGILSRIILQKKYSRGITCISSNPNMPNRVTEPLAWLIECLVNKKDFSGSLPEQYAKCK